MLIELGSRGTASQGRAGGLRRALRDRGRPPLRRHAPDRAPLAAGATRGAASPVSATPPRGPLSCPHQTPSAVETRIVELRGEHDAWGPRTDRPPPGARGGDARCPRARRSTAASCVRRLIEPQKRRRKRCRLPPLGTRCRPWSSGRWTSWAGCRLADGRELKARHRDRRPLALLRLRAASRRGHRASGLRGPHRPPCARYGAPDAGPDRQRQGLHGALRQRLRRGALRPPLARARRPPPADRAAEPDDHRQGRALPQDAEERVPRRAGLRLSKTRPRRPSTPGSRATTPSAPTRASAWPARRSASRPRAASRRCS